LLAAVWAFATYLEIDTELLEENCSLASNLAGLEAAGADVLTLGCTSNLGLYALDIWIPAAAGLAHRVGDAVAEAWSFAANVAGRGHGELP